MKPDALQAHGSGLYTYEREITMLGAVRMPARMTILTLDDGSLVLHSPLELGPDLRARIEELGPVRFVVAPNDFHHLFYAAARAAYPEAQGLVAPGLPAKVSSLAYDAVLGDGSSLPESWRGCLAAQLVAGMPRVNEVVFLHRPSRTAVFTDLVFNLRHLDSPAGRIFFTLTGAYKHFGPSRLARFAVRDRAAVTRSVERILEWDFDRVVMAHGDVVEVGGHAALATALRSL